jgi:uncharacterized membrane protein
MIRSAAAYRRLLRSPHLHLFLFVVCAFVACGALLSGRILLTRSGNYLFLPFNLVLATFPLLFSTLFTRADRVGARTCFAGLWLLFFPNAPYIITDLMHLTKIGGANGAPLWFDILLVTAYAGAGLVFGYISLLQVQSSIETNFPRLGWGVAVLSCFLAGFGIYLGRFLRWHSVHLFIDPVPLLRDVVDRFANPFHHPRTWGVTLGFGMLILFGYMALVMTARLLHLSRDAK